MAQLRDGYAGQRRAEILGSKPGIEVGHEDRIDILGLESRGGDRRQGGIANQLLEVDRIEFAERRVAPADDIGLIHD